MECLKISLGDIKEATNNFDEKCYIGSGGFAKVYKAELNHLDVQNMKPSDWNTKSELPKKRSIAAIKRISNIRDGKDGFFTEIETLTSCSHQNVVSLLGYSKEDSEMVLVFEFASNGCLDTCLEKNKMKNLTWAQRIQICLDIAHGLQYLHTNMEGKRTILHRDVKSANILLDEKWHAKVADFGLSKIYPAGKTLMTTFVTKHIAGTEVYMDPEYISTTAYKKECDIYSFGVVLFEVLSGRLAYDKIYNMGNDKGLSMVARRHFNKGTIKELIDTNMMEEANEHIFTVNKEPNQKSLDAFTKIAYQCLAEKQVERPKMDVIIKELGDALNFQGKSLVLAKFQLRDILSATHNFSAECCIGVGAYGTMYNAKLQFDSNILPITERKAGGEQPKRSNINVALKRIFKRETRHAKHGFFAEIDTLASFDHPNIVSLLGVASEDHEMVLIYKDDFKRSLHDYLRNTNKVANLTWAQRIQISLDIAHGLNYLQTSTEDIERIMQFTMNSTNILLDAKWRAKIACFWHSRFISADKEANILNINNIVDIKVQSDPEYIKIEKLKNESGIYSFGVILFQIMCGKVQYDESYYTKNEKGLPIIARRCFEERTLLKEMIDPNLKEQETDRKTFRLNEEVNQDSFDAFSKIAYECCALAEADRPLMEDIIKELEMALNLQEKHFEHLKTRVMEKADHLEHLEHLKIPLNDILVATKNFSNQYLIGSGGYSKVYKAKLGHFDGVAIGGKNKGDLIKRQSIVAIKRINSREDEQGSEGFFAELQTLSHCKHPNIVSLLGFCLEDDEMILVLEYTSNGSLDDILRNSDKMTDLSWAQRIQICLEIARGLFYLHTNIKEKQTIHRDIKSANILFNDNWVAKIADFGLRIVNHAYQQSSNMETNIIAGTKVYLDPEYVKTGRLKEESDIYSLGVVLFEIMCGKLAYHKTFNEGGLAAIARKCFEDGTLMQIIDPRMSKDDENVFMLNGGLNQDSLETFSKIAYKCLEETQAKRPKIEAVIRELEKAHFFQTNSMDKLQISLERIKSMTEDFSVHKIIGEGRCWKQYEGEVARANKYITLIVKRFDNSDKQHHHFNKELEILSNYKHENIIGLEGYYRDIDEEAIIIYKCVSNGRLSDHLDDANVTWMKRLKICIDVACGLHLLHTSGGVTKDIRIIHTDLKSSCILLNRDWRAKISNLESSLFDGEHKETEDVTDNVYGSLGYLDPEYKQSGELTHKSDIYSLGVVLLEILCGRLAWAEGCEDPSHSLAPLAKQCFKEGKLDELVFDSIKEQIDPESLTTFVDIAIKCLEDDRGERPEANEVVTQLRKALEIYETSDLMYEAKLPRDYEEILRLTKLDNNTKKKDIYNMLCKGVLLRDREVCLSLGSNGEKQYTISARKFSYKNRSALKWRHIEQSRFEYVAEMLALSNLNIKCKIRTRFLSPGVNYGVHLVFKFCDPRKIPICDPRKISVKPMYVNLTYKMGNDTFHAYFATWRDEEWMKIELCQFLNHNEGINFELQLESFSSLCYGKGVIYLEGIEFRVIDNVKHEQTEKTKEVQQVSKSFSNVSYLQQLPSESGEILRRPEEDVANKLFSLNEGNIKKKLILSAKEVLYDSTNVKHFHVIPSAESRSQEVIEVLPQQVLRISCKIESQMLSQDTKYLCYLVFKLSEKCHGLHCPVKVRDLGRWKNKEDKIIYFRSPNPWNSHDFNHIPVKREDGWMEVNVWNFNSNHKLQNDYFWANLKLISYEGTMAGLIVCGLEFRPM